MKIVTAIKAQSKLNMLALLSPYLPRLLNTCSSVQQSLVIIKIRNIILTLGGQKNIHV